MNSEVKRITAFIQSLGGGGAQGVLVTVMNYYRTLGYKVIVVVESLNNDVNSKKLNKDIQVISLEVSSTKAALKKTIAYIKRNNMDYAFAFSPEIAVNLYIARCITCKDFIVIGRCINTLSAEYSRADTFFRKYITCSLIKLVYKRINCIIVQANNMGSDLHENFDVPYEKIKVINNPLAEKYEEIICDDTPNEKKDYLLYVGRLEKQKGIEMLLNAFSNIDNKTIKLKLVGKGTEKSTLTILAEQLGISERIEFIDFSSDVETYYKSAIATVLSSYYEGFPNVLIESIACGTPVTSFDLPSGPSDIVIEGVNGYLAEYLDIPSLTEAINKTISTDWNMRTIKNTAIRFTRKNILKKYKEALLLDEDKR